MNMWSTQIDNTMKTINLSLWLCLLFTFYDLSLLANGDPKSTRSNPEITEWKLKKETEEIKVYYRKSEDSRVNEVKLITTVEASLSTLISVLRDVSNYPNWIYKCEKAHAIGKSSTHGGQYYTELDFPWPLQDRDMIAQSEIVQDRKTKVVTIRVTGRPKLLAEKEGIVRIKTLALEWVLTPLPGGQVRINYQLLSDPGGNLPSWLINMAVDQGPTQTIMALRKQIQDGKYSDAKLNYIAELTH